MGDDSRRRAWTRPADHAAAAAWTAVVIALADGGLALSRLAQPASPAGRHATLALAVGSAVWTAAPIAVLCGVAAKLVGAHVIGRPARVRALIGAIGATLVASVVIAIAVLDLGEVDWRGVDRGLVALPLLAAACFVLMLSVLRRAPVRAGRIGAIAAIVSAVAAAGAFVVAAPTDRGEALANVDEASTLTRRIVQVATRLLDRDADGHPRLLCGETCDCDDTDPAIGPLAAEIAGNGIDEDCDGVDASAEELAAIDAAFARPEPVARPQSEAPAAPPNFLLVTIDTLRADHLGVYGYPRDTSPNIDAWAASAVVFEQARSTGPSTRFSVPPLMIGKWFTEIERERWEWPAIGKSETLVTERIDPLGYTSAAFHSIRYLRPQYNLDQGFDHYSDRALDDRGPPLRMVSSDYITDEALAWIDEVDLATKRPFFLWAYYGDPHSQYVRHPEVPTFGPEYKDAYDNEIAFVDLHVGRLFEGLKARGLTDNLVVILTADHGEGLDAQQDHGTLYHSKNLHDELVRVPLIVSGPGFLPRRVTTPVSLVDFAPTVIDLVGMPNDPALRGVSLRPWLLGEDPPHPPVFFEKHRALDDPQKGMVAWPYKVILTVPTGRMQIFDLSADPGERDNIIGRLPAAERKRLTAMLRHWASNVLEPYRPEYRH